MLVQLGAIWVFSEGLMNLHMDERVKPSCGGDGRTPTAASYQVLASETFPFISCPADSAPLAWSSLFLFIPTVSLFQQKQFLQ